jgi:glycosyltransferase involved in cell wall biosynthesis
VVIITYNDKDRLLDCLHSLRKQSYPTSDFEILIVDDGSTDQTAEIVEARFPEVTVLRKPNSGPDNSRNFALARATGEIIAFIDSDCVAPPDWLTNMDRSVRHNDACLVGGPIRHQGNFWTRLIGISDFGEFQGLTFREVFNLPSCNLALPRQLLNGCYFHSEVRFGGDVLLCNELRRLGRRLIFDPSIQIFHRPTGDWQSFLRRAGVYGEGFVLLRLIDPSLRYGWVLKGGVPGILLATLARSGLDSYRLLRFRKPAGFAFWELPPAIFLLVLKRALSLPASFAAYRRRQRIHASPAPNR